MTAAEYQLGVDEKSFQATVTEMAHRFGWLSIHIPNAICNPAGLPDLILLRGGVCLFVELKTERGRLGRRQQEWAIDLEAAGFPVRIWRPSMFEAEIEATLQDAPRSEIEAPQSDATPEKAKYPAHAHDASS